MISPSSRRRVSLGFTLIEAVLSAAIFASVLLGVLGLAIYGVRTIHGTRERMYISRVLETTIEEARNLSWDELAAQPASQNFDTAHPTVALFGKQVNPGLQQGAEFASPLKAATGTIFVDDVDANLKKITVQVSHQPYLTKSRSVSYSSVTYISRNGIDRH